VLLIRVWYTIAWTVVHSGSVLVIVRIRKSINARDNEDMTHRVLILSPGRSPPEGRIETARLIDDATHEVES
jgi:hypothetical protein